MAKAEKLKFVRSKPHCNVGTIGHVDHGKTTLTAAITRVLSKSGGSQFMRYDQIDKSPEEKKRGITITASHVEYETANRHYTHIDCPGHQNYIKNMITGAAQMEGAILVVDVTQGPQEQTREHVILAKEVGVPYMLVYGNKMDALLDPTMKDFVEMETRALVSSYGFPDDLPMIFGSARKALEETEESAIGHESVVALMDMVDKYVQLPQRPVNEPFLMAIEDIFTIQGRGTVLTGKVESGTITVGAEVEIVGAKTLKTVCTGLEMYHKVLDSAQVGENVGALVRNVRKDEVRRGYVLAKPGFLKASFKFEAKAYLLTKEEGGRHKPFKSSYKPQFFFRTANITGEIILKEAEVAMPGETITFEVKLVEKAAINDGLRFVMREGTKTLGAGIILKVLE